MWLFTVERTVRTVCSVVDNVQTEGTVVLGRRLHSHSGPGLKRTKKVLLKVSREVYVIFPQCWKDLSF